MAYAGKLTVIICWVPGHSGILGNEIAGQDAAVAALRSGVEIPHVSYERTAETLNAGKNNGMDKLAIDCT